MATTERPSSTADRDRMKIDPETSFAHYRTCPLCEATCGLELTVEGDQVLRIRGDQDDVFSKGYLCPKGPALKGLHHDPDRLRTPLVRTGEIGDPDAFTEVTWSEAFAKVESLLEPVWAEHGRSAVGAYLGNPNAHNFAAGLFGRPFLKALGTRNLYSASTVDQMPKHVSSALMFGQPSMIPVPDLDHTDLLVMLGANPWKSNGSLATAPDFPGRVKAIQERGGRVIVVDPRRSRTAEEADQHLFIRPGTDAHLLVAVIRVIINSDLVDLGRLGDHIAGLDELVALVDPFTLSEVAAVTGIVAETIDGLAREIAAASSAAVYGRIGVHTTEFGTLAAWAVDVIAAITANLDEPGGHLFPLGAHMRVDSDTPGGRGFAIGRWQSRVRELGEALGELPVATMADEMLTEGEGRLRALFTIAGNPARSTPDTDRLEQALAGLDVMISVDPYLNETTRFADVILPPPTPLERSQYDMAFYGLSVRNIANYSPPLFEADGPSEATILATLALIASGQGADSDPGVVEELLLGGLANSEVNRSGSPVEGRNVDELLGMVEGDTPEDRVLDFMVRTGPYGDGFGTIDDGLSLAVLRDNPHGIDLGPLEPRLPNILKTASGLVELSPPEIAGDLGRLSEALVASAAGDASAADQPLLLVGRRHLRSNNSWMHNVGNLVKGRERCTLQLHPADAERIGLADGDQARVRSAVGEVDAPVEVTDSVMAGVVSLPHGWGHDAEGTAMTVAEAHAGTNSNALTDPAPLDPLSGNAVLNGIPVTVSAS